MYVLASHCRPTVCETVSWKGMDASLGTRSQAGGPQGWQQSASLPIVFFLMNQQRAPLSHDACRRAALALGFNLWVVVAQGLLRAGTGSGALSLGT